MRGRLSPRAALAVALVADALGWGALIGFVAVCRAWMEVLAR